MSLFPDSNNSECRGLFEDTKKSLNELAKNLEISSVSNSFFTEIVIQKYSRRKKLEASGDQVRTSRPAFPRSRTRALSSCIRRIITNGNAFWCTFPTDFQIILCLALEIKLYFGPDIVSVHIFAFLRF